MSMRSRLILVLAGSLVSLAMALYFGLTAHTMLGNYPYPDKSITDWGKVALTLVFGLGGCLGLASVLRKAE